MYYLEEWRTIYFINVFFSEFFSFRLVSALLNCAIYFRFLHILIYNLFSLFSIFWVLFRNYTFYQFSYSIYMFLIKVLSLNQHLLGSSIFSNLCNLTKWQSQVTPHLQNDKHRISPDIYVIYLCSFSNLVFPFPMLNGDAPPHCWGNFYNIFIWPPVGCFINIIVLFAQRGLSCPQRGFSCPQRGFSCPHEQYG